MINFNDEHKYPLSDRDGIYGGNAGAKNGILIDGEYWLIKYPKTTRGMSVNPEEISYTTSPLSEYLGSHIYEILGFNVHQTILGVKNNKVVVACKDFCAIRGGLSEIRTLKNAYSEEMAEKLEEISESKSGDRVNLRELLIHLDENRHLKDVPGLKDHFWDMVVIDILIDNNDRNNGNWGLVFHDGRYDISPVYDNGNAFSNKMSEEKIAFHLESREKLNNSVIGSAMTAYDLDEHMINSVKMVKLDEPGLKAALLRNVPIIEEKMQQILQLIDEVPEYFENILVCSSNRKRYYKAGIEIRFEEILKKAYRNYFETE